MTKVMLRNLRDEYAKIIEEDQVTSINTFEKPEYSPLDMREDEVPFAELVSWCSEPVSGFHGRNAFLGLDYVSPIEIKGHWFLTALHAVAYYRCKYSKDAVKYEAGNEQSLNEVRDVRKHMFEDIVRSDWDSISQRYYQAILDAKFSQNPELKRYALSVDGVCRFSRIEGGEAMACALGLVISNIKAEAESNIRKYGSIGF